MVVATQIGVALGAAFTGGPESAVILWAVVPMVSMPSRFGTRATWVGAALTFVAIGSSGTEPRLAGARRQPRSHARDDCGERRLPCLRTRAAAERGCAAARGKP